MLLVAKIAIEPTSATTAKVKSRAMGEKVWPTSLVDYV